MQDPANFGEALRQHRIAHRLTQAQLAEVAGLSERGISDLERGLKHPQRGTLHLLVDALGLSAVDAAAFELMGRTRVPRSPPDNNGLTVVRHNLPSTLTSFVGRQDEISTLQGVLSPQ